MFQFNVLLHQFPPVLLLIWMNQLKEDFGKMFVTGEFFVYYYCFVLF